MINNAAENSRLQAEILKQMDEKLRLAGNFNVRGGLEKIIMQAKNQNKIPCHLGVQAGLDRLAATKAFEIILNRVADDRGLARHLVWGRAKHLFDEVSKHAHGNDEIITVRAKDFTPAECAALVAYLNLQKEWTPHLDWIEEKLVK